MIKVNCLLCEMLPEPKKVELFSKIISKNEQDAMRHLGEVLTSHITANHPEALDEIAHSMPMWATFNLLKYFDEVGLEESKYEEEKEDMRDKLAAMLMFGADEEEEEDDYEEDEPEEEGEEDGEFIEDLETKKVN